MPKLGLEMEQGTVLEWFRESEDDVSEGDKLAEVESEKSIGEVEAREDGVLRRIYVEEGKSVPPGTPIGILAAADTDISDLEAEAEAEINGKTEAERDTTAEPSDTEDDAVTVETQSAASAGSSAAPAAAEETTEVKASPRARNRAEELGVDLMSVEGTGPMDSITEDDVEAAVGDGTEREESIKASPRAKKRAEEAGVDLTSVEGTGPMDSITEDDVEAAAEATRESGSEVRQITPERTASNRFERATAVADPSAGAALLETTEAVRSAFEERVTSIDVLLVVASAALADRPLMNGIYAESTHQLRESQDIALVTELDGELHTGVVPNVEEKSLTEIVDTRERLDDDSEGEPSFTLANASKTDSDGMLVNPPCVAALEFDATGQRAVPEGSGVDLRPLVTASLTYDTRAIDGSEADAFLQRLFERAERASELVLESYRGTE
ncbi:E3 binding domain-containing protein [Natrialba aegyptia]|nr:E3 binding domain-containing protein [Natrialba aegyptia]